MRKKSVSIKEESLKRNSCDLESRNLFKRSCVQVSLPELDSRVTGALLTLVFVFSNKAWPIFGATRLVCSVVFVVDVVFVLH